MKTIMILITVCSFLAFLYGEVKKRLILKINIYVQSKEYGKLEKLLYHPCLRLLFLPLALLHVQLEVAILKKDIKGVEHLTSKILNRRISEQQKSDLYFQIFDFYVNIMDCKKAKEYLDKINKLSDTTLIENANMIYSIIVEHKDNYLEKLLSKVEHNDDFQSAYFEFLIAEIYKNKKEFKKEKEFRERVSLHLQEIAS